MSVDRGVNIQYRLSDLLVQLSDAYKSHLNILHHICCVSWDSAQPKHLNEGNVRKSVFKRHRLVVALSMSGELYGLVEEAS